MTASRNEMIYNIMSAIGSDCDRDLAERVFENLRADGRIYFDDTVSADRQGFRLRDDVDLLAAAIEAA